MPSLPSQTDKGKKRKGSTSGVGTSTSSSTKVAERQAFGSALSQIQAALSSSSDLNPIADLIDLVSKSSFDLPSDVVMPSITLLGRTLAHLVSSGVLSPVAVSNVTGLLSIQPSQNAGSTTAPEQVESWLRQIFNSAVQLLVRVMIAHPKEKTRVVALNALMDLQRSTSQALSQQGEVAAWAECPWRATVNALVFGRCQDVQGLEVKSTLCPEVRATFILDYIEQYADAKLALYRTFQSILKTTPTARSAILAFLLQLSNPPANVAAIKKLGCYVAALAVAPPGGATKLDRGRTVGNGKKKEVKISQDGDESDEEEAEDLDWFSDSEADDGDTAERAESAQPGKGRTAQDVGLPAGSRIRRRRRGAGKLVFHQALYAIKAWRVAVDALWLAILLHRSPKADIEESGRVVAGHPSEGQLDLGEINAILRVMEKKVLPYLSKPQLVADWLVDCLDVGGSTALLSLSPLYTLYVSHSLSLPGLYTTLYTLLTPSLLHSPHRSHSLRLLALFLSSQKLPLGIVLAFLKRLSRCALRGPPGGAIPVAVMIYNLLKTHKEGMNVLHQDWAADGKQGWTDPYDASITVPPSSAAARHTSLFEVTTLGASPPASSLGLDPQGRQEAHYHAPTTTILRMLAQPFTKEAYDLEEFLDHSFGTLIETEVARSLKTPNGKKRTREPAVRFSLSTESAKRVRVYPRKVEQRSAPVMDVSESLSDAGNAAEPAAASATLAGLDAEEVEAHEAMQEVERAQVQAQAQARQERKDRGKLPNRVGNVLALWSYASLLDNPKMQ
ncbi:CBF-domain-containing protein [Microstroma glucosiphilum]|uniref:CBF-domain-containing protein n=1 Tax=Pseudomicrostroma glucosiphilum TaxID=1684307 RepID=A0A316U6D8_9BASI|nr:CBF-domain-containing protein [Pseudomicrostroma glucosiphilum]PWN20394.1 CBF-domain-containing protein [Pseudomicrostroma glucosiphilum]